jgi:hypothetical protein
MLVPDYLALIMNKRGYIKTHTCSRMARGLLLSVFRMSNSNASRRSVSLTLPSTEKIMAACSALN